MPDLLTRRKLLGRISLALSGLAAAVIGVPIIGYLLSPLLGPPQQAWRAVGRVDDFGIGTTTTVTYGEPSPLPWAGQTAATAAWLRREANDQFIAFAITCTHLGCPVDWRPDAQLFLCPCHGGVYYSDGRVAAGPPPRPLFRLDVRVREGMVEILTRGLQVVS